ncbi:MAG TPA: PAS-domain containing protein [Alphaproteobacteria bacterium]|nr:PAS-domain containing protein [Alphaproteobacteria bacterium]
MRQKAAQPAAHEAMPKGVDERAHGLRQPPTVTALGAVVDPAMFVTILNHLTQGIAVYDARMRLVICNHHYLEMFEYPDNLVRPGVNYENILRYNLERGEYGTENAEANFQERLGRARSASVGESRYEHVRPNGAVIAVRRAPLPGGGFVDTYTNITPRKNAERDAARNAAILQATIDNMADGIRVFDSDCRLLAWNKRAFEIFGFPETLAEKGTPYAAFLDYAVERGDYKGVAETQAEKLGRARNPTVRKLEQQLGNGRYVEKRRNPMPGGGFVSTYFDVTDRKRTEQELARQASELASAMDELKRSNEELQQFAYVASHDLQEPLRMIGSYCQLLQRRYGGKLDSDADEFIGFAVEGAKRMQRLINDLLLYSRVGTKGKEFAPTRLDDVLAGVLANLTIAAAEAKAKITHDSLPKVVGDSVQLTQLLQNLIANALKFREAGTESRIHIGAARDADKWRISIRDNGIGIEPQYAERIFMIFQRLNTRQEYPGTGIGLSICKKIVERHGGRIWVEPAPDKGSIFTFTLPATGDEP